MYVDDEESTKGIDSDFQIHHHVHNRNIGGSTKITAVLQNSRTFIILLCFYDVTFNYLTSKEKDDIKKSSANLCADDKLNEANVIQKEKFITAALYLSHICNLCISILEISIQFSVA